MVEVDLLAVIVAAIAAFVIMMAWYSQALFGKAWMQASGWTEADMKRAKEKGMGKTFIIQFVANVVMGWVLAKAIGIVGLVTFAEGMTLAFWLWLGFVATVGLGIVLWDGKPWKLYLINVGGLLVGMAVMGGILAIW